MKIKRLLTALVVCVCVIVVSAGAAFAEDAPAEPAYAERVTKVLFDGAEAGELTLRFYEETPNVPYLGIGAYSQYMRGQPLTLRENGDGTCALVNGIGAELRCDPEAGTILIPDWGRFFDMPLPLEDEAKGWKDTNAHFVRITSVEYEGEAAPVTLDFAKYGIAVYADQDDVYLPVSVVSNIMTDISVHYMLYDGENLHSRYFYDPTKGSVALEGRKAELEGQARPDDLIRQCYAELCFNFDHFFGHPGVARLDAAIAEKGLDEALKDSGMMGELIREELLSSDLTDYLSGMIRLFMICLYDGHNSFLSFEEMVNDPVCSSNLPLIAKLESSYDMAIMHSPVFWTQFMRETIPVQRAAVWGDEYYREYGSTAIIRLDEFYQDEAAWADYYSGEGDLPEDALGNVISGLRRASENPEIKNVIFDLSCNNGGSSDMAMEVLAMTTGQDKLYGLQKLTGQRMTFTYEADTNLDGVFDDRDRETRYDFNYGVLVTPHAFSMGNLFPIIMREGGAVVIGDPSSGGSCCVQFGTDAEGFIYIMSSAKWQATDSQWVDVEGGCEVDLPIEPIPSPTVDILFANLGFDIDDGLPSFEAYFDDAMLDAMMNDWFQAQAKAA